MSILHRDPNNTLAKYAASYVVLYKDCFTEDLFSDLHWQVHKISSRRHVGNIRMYGEDGVMMYDTRIKESWRKTRAYLTFELRYYSKVNSVNQL